MNLSIWDVELLPVAQFDGVLPITQFDDDLAGDVIQETEEAPIRVSHHAIDITTSARPIRRKGAPVLRRQGTIITRRHVLNRRRIGVKSRFSIT